MKKMLLIDGNNMLFKAYHATSYGMMMKTSNGIPTNAVYGFVMMIEKALSMIQPDEILVAWDSGKPTFRHQVYAEYKGTRKEVDQELIVQMPMAREYLDAAGIYRYEADGIEADDIIGTMAKRYPDHTIHILSSDKDLWQLIDPTTNVYVMKKGLSEIEIIDETKLMETKGITPAQIIDLKALMGDASDNIPGVKGVGEKTALKLLADYQTVDQVYEHLDEIKGKLKEKLETDKEQAFLSKMLATIKTDLALPFEADDLHYEKHEDALYDFFVKYEMNSLLKKQVKKPQAVNIHCEAVPTISESLLQGQSMIWADIDCENYYDATLYGFAVANEQLCEYIRLEDLKNDQCFLQYLNQSNWITAQAKDVYHALHKANIAFRDAAFDVSVAVFLLDASINDYEKLLMKYGLESSAKEDIYGKAGKPKLSDEQERISYCATQCVNMYTLTEQIKQELQEKEMWELFTTIEMPLIRVLFEMEKNGVSCDLEVLAQIATATEVKINELTEKIYAIAGYEFNINSPKQLAVVLYDKLGLKAGKKRSTSADVLEKLIHVHPIIPMLLEHRKYAKLYSTYAVGLSKHVHRDGKIHTLFNQTQTQTGRLSSSEPNLQNISVRDEEGKEIRKAFVAAKGCVLMSADYSQIELRMLAHMANEAEMISAFNHGIDIHTKTAMQIFDVSKEAVDANMRRTAKTVNFGIVYGQSDFGLSEQLGITRKEAHDFIEKYFASYPNIKQFMDATIAYCEEHGYVKTLFQRRRYIKEIKDKNYMMREFGKRAAMNAPIQGSAADLIKVAMIRVYHAMQEADVQAKMILQIHDELIFEVPEAEIEQMKQIVEKGMQEAMKLSVPLIAEATIGKNWYEAK